MSVSTVKVGKEEYDKVTASLTGFMNGQMSMPKRAHCMHSTPSSEWLSMNTLRSTQRTRERLCTSSVPCPRVSGSPSKQPTHAFRPLGSPALLLFLSFWSCTPNPSLKPATCSSKSESHPSCLLPVYLPILETLKKQSEISLRKLFCMLVKPQLTPISCRMLDKRTMHWLF